MSQKKGKPYIFHPLRVMMALDGDDEAMQIGVLHDVLEDSAFTPDALRAEGISDAVIDGVVALTRRKDVETYAEYIQRVKRNPLARKVKIADIEDNISRADSLPYDDAVRLLKRYHAAWQELRKELRTGET